MWFIRSIRSRFHNGLGTTALISSFIPLGPPLGAAAIEHTLIDRYRLFRVFSPGVTGRVPPRLAPAKFPGIGRALPLPKQTDYRFAPRFHLTQRTKFRRRPSGFPQGCQIARDHRATAGQSLDYR